MIIHKNISLRNYNTFKVDVNATFLLFIENVSDLEVFSSTEFSHIEPRLIMGGGSNLLFTTDFDGVILHSQIRGIEKVFENETEVWLKAGSGIVWDDFVSYCVNLNLGGIENLSNIPGCIGSAPVQNIGAYGMEAKDSIQSVDCYDFEMNKTINLVNSECRFGYRESIFKTAEYKSFFITNVTFRLKKNPEPVTNYGTVEQELSKFPNRSLKSVRQAIINIRSSKLPPEELGSAGSFFKNPVIDAEKAHFLLERYPKMPNYKQPGNTFKIPAAWLIENSGLKGFRLKNVGTHEKQPLVIVNFGNATGKEIVGFSNLIQEKVSDSFGIILEPEVCFI
jgi:UDP-N-acetylmuramate dehydrogenase